jgi:hypothetical protein
MRILVTGSRKWKYRMLLSFALAEAAGDTPAGEVTVVHGAGGNADLMAGREARSLMFHVEPHPADWHGCCGHVVEGGDEKQSRFSFVHPYGEDHREFARGLLREQFGEEHVADLDWDNCIISED